MKIDICQAPPTLWFGAGDRRFGLDLKRFTAVERAMVVDALVRNDFAEVQRAAGGLVVGWREVCNEQGLPIPFEEMDLDRRVVRNLDKFLGAVPMVDQMRVLAGILAFLGVPASNVEYLVRAFAPGETADPRPTQPPDGATPRSACAE